MAYTPTTWVTGDIITAEKLNKIEQGIANAGGGSWTVLTEESVTVGGEGGSLTYNTQITADTIKVTFNGTEYGTAENTTWTNNQQNTHLSNISLTAGDKLRVYGRNTRGTSYYICAPMLVIIEA